MNGADGLEKVYREEATRIRAALAARLGDVGLAEELVQDAFIEALEHWRAEGVPPNPGGWLATTARRKAIDRLRRERAGREKLALLAAAQPRRAGPGGRPGGPGDLESGRTRTRTTICLAWSSHAAIRRCRGSRRLRSPCAPFAV